MAQVNPYAILPSVCITESFEAAVDVMDKASLTNSSLMLTSQKSTEHQLGQLAVKPDNPTEAAFKDVCQETIVFTNDGPPSLHCTFNENYPHHII